MPGNFMQAILYFPNRRIRRGGSRCNAGDVGVHKPFDPQITFALHVLDPFAVFGTTGGQFTGVVAFGSTDEDDHIALLCQFNG